MVEGHMCDQYTTHEGGGGGFWGSTPQDKDKG